MFIYLPILEFPTVFGLIFSIFSLVQDSNVSTCQILQFQLIIITQLIIIDHFEMIKGVKMRLILNITNLCYFCYFSQFSPYSAIFSCFLTMKGNITRKYNYWLFLNDILEREPILRRLKAVLGDLNLLNVILAYFLGYLFLHRYLWKSERKTPFYPDRARLPRFFC